jgi:nitrite reductase (NADH) small subunit
VWVRVCRLSDVPDDRGWPVDVGGRRIAVFVTPDGVRAVANACAHLGNPLDDGPVSGEILTCPWHGWQYDLRSGHQLTVFGRRPGLAVYPARVEDDWIAVDV